jgi:methylated-DNA-[protein]-cysteine S-methyltransferase
MIYTHEHACPLGTLTLEGDGEHLLRIRLPEESWSPDPTAERRADPAPFAAAVHQLDAYFARERCAFDLPLAPSGTAFQRRVWALLQEIPWGTTISYAALARRAGNPAACRAVGAANGRNPLPIVIPCHRVVGSDGRLTGYAGGLAAKRDLLALEGLVLAV